MTVAARSEQSLRLRLSSGLHSLPLHRIHFLTGFATLHGEPEDYFLGWLTFHGQQVPVFDLNRVVCEQPTPEHFGSRILLVAAPASTGVPFLGLLAPDVTTTVAAPSTSPQPGKDDSGEPASDPAPAVKPLDLDNLLPMLYTLIPPHPQLQEAK